VVGSSLKLPKIGYVSSWSSCKANPIGLRGHAERKRLQSRVGVRPTKVGYVSSWSSCEANPIRLRGHAERKRLQSRVGVRPTTPNSSRESIRLE